MLVHYQKRSQESTSRSPLDLNVKSHSLYLNIAMLILHLCNAQRWRGFRRTKREIRSLGQAKPLENLLLNLLLLHCYFLNTSSPSESWSFFAVLNGMPITANLSSPGLLTWDDTIWSVIHYSYAAACNKLLSYLLNLLHLIRNQQQSPMLFSMSLWGFASPVIVADEPLQKVYNILVPSPSGNLRCICANIFCANRMLDSISTSCSQVQFRENWFICTRILTTWIWHELLSRFSCSQEA